MKKKIATGIFCIIALQLRVFSEEVAVSTSHGVIVGERTLDGDRFLGIRYAKPPIGELRWRSPEPVDPWDIFHATEYGADCWQPSDEKIPKENMSEDCLFLNIWTPSRSNNDPLLPVMVWIYGGGFQQGTSSHSMYNGNMFAKRGVVLVSFNYRVGALGFMVLVNDNIWGNYGLQDQWLVLNWVHDHISSFGGNVEQITLFGESAGAMSVGLHMGMNVSSNFFHQAIMQSNPLGYKFRSATVANFLGEAVKRGIDCGDIQCMRKESARNIVNQQKLLYGVPRSVGDFFTWGPVVIDYIHASSFGKYSVLYDEFAPLMNVTQPFISWTSAESHSEKPVIMGINAHEGHMFVYTAFPYPMPKYVYWAFVAALFRQSTPLILRQYSRLADDYKSTGDYRPVMSQIMHDYLFFCPLFFFADVLKEKAATSTDAAQCPVYIYKFSHPTRVPDYSVCNGLACHTAELPFVFEQHQDLKRYSFYAVEQSCFLSKHIDVPSVDLRVSCMMMNFWTNFAKNKTPNGKNEVTQWPCWRDNEYLELKEVPAVLSGNDCICQFWNKLNWKH